MKSQKCHALLGFLLLIVFMCMMSLVTFAEVRGLRYDKNYRVDLDGDGKKETLKLKEDHPTGIYINKKKIWSAKSNKKWDSDHYDGGYWYLCDIKKNDKYKEIMLCLIQRIYIYRYKNGRIKLYATSGLNTEGIGYNGLFARSMTSDTHPIVSGDGLIKLTTMLWATDTNYNGQELFVNLAFRVKNKKLVVAKDEYHEINAKAQIEFAQKNKKYLRTKGKKTYVYQYPRGNNNKCLFVLKKGIKYKPLQIKITSKYVFVEIKVLNSENKGGSGWIGLDKKKVNKGEHYWTFS